MVVIDEDDENHLFYTSLTYARNADMLVIPPPTVSGEGIVFSGCAYSRCLSVIAYFA